MGTHRPIDRPPGATATRAGGGWALAALLLTAAPVHAQGPAISLEEAYARARARSKEILLSRERVIEAEVNVRRAWAALKPQLGASFTYTHTAPEPEPFTFPPLPRLDSPIIRDACARTESGVANLEQCVAEVLGAIGDAANTPPQSFDFARADTAIFSANVSWNVFNGRAIPLLMNAYDAVDLEGARARSGETELLLAVARAFYAAHAAKNGVEASRRAALRAEQELRVTEAQSELGEAIPARLKSARIAARQAATEEKRAENTRLRALQALAVLTRSPERPDVLPPPPRARPAADRATLLASAKAQREDLRALSVAVTIAERAEADAWWRFAPSLTLFGSYRYSNVGGLSLQNEQWAAGLTATLPLYDGGLRYAELDAARSQLRGALLARESLEERIEAELDRGLLELEAAELSLERARDALALAEERKALVLAQRTAGTLRDLDVTQANDLVLDADLAVIAAEAERALAVITLEKAAGLFSP